MGGSNSTGQQIQEKQLISKIDSENVQQCKEHSEEKLLYVCTEDKCKNKMELLCRICINKQRDNPHKNHRLQNIKEILQELVSNFKRLDVIGASNNNINNSNYVGNTPNRSISSVTNNILGTHTQGIASDQDIDESFKKLASDFLILSTNCKEYSEMIMQSLIQAKEEAKKIDLENTRTSARKIMIDIANTCQQPNLNVYTQNVKKLEQFLKFDGTKAKFIDNDGTLRKQVKKGTTEWLNSIWEEMKQITISVNNIRLIGPLLPAKELINSIQKKQKTEQSEVQLKQYLKQQQLLQQQQQQELEEQMQQETQRRQEVEEFLSRQRDEEEKEQRRMIGIILHISNKLLLFFITIPPLQIGNSFSFFI